MDEVGITCIAGLVADCETEVAMFEHEWNYISLCFIVWIVQTYFIVCSLEDN